MGIGGSRNAAAGQVVYVHELPKCLEERLQLKYERGMRGVLPSLTSSLGIFVALQQIAVGMETAVSAKLTTCEGRDSIKEGMHSTTLLASPHACLSNLSHTTLVICAAGRCLSQVSRAQRSQRPPLVREAFDSS